VRWAYQQRCDAALARCYVAAALAAQKLAILPPPLPGIVRLCRSADL
jgi:hypothetical protein